MCKEATSVPKTLIFCHTKDVTSKVYNVLCNSAVKSRVVGTYHASLTRRQSCMFNSSFKVPLICVVWDGALYYSLAKLHVNFFVLFPLT